ncbi:unnamed protein product [Closterium sp. NIES-65]|nr:unnamed protein product [Closterium sp. NIES-65]
MSHCCRVSDGELREGARRVPRYAPSPRIPLHFLSPPAIVVGGRGKKGREWRRNAVGGEGRGDGSGGGTLLGGEGRGEGSGSGTPVMIASAPASAPSLTHRLLLQPVARALPCLSPPAVAAVGGRWRGWGWRVSRREKNPVIRLHPVCNPPRPAPPSDPAPYRHILPSTMKSPPPTVRNRPPPSDFAPPLSPAPFPTGGGGGGVLALVPHPLHPCCPYPVVPHPSHPCCPYPVVLHPFHPSCSCPTRSMLPGLALAITPVRPVPYIT